MLKWTACGLVIAISLAAFLGLARAEPAATAPAAPPATRRALDLRSTAATGSMSAGSDTLALTGPSTFRVGDRIIVEIGGEPGAGARGTRGVGGSWPTLSYADASARTADASQAADTYAWQADTGRVWQWVAGSWQQPASLLGDAKYYTNTAIPRSLVTTVTATNGDGSILTLQQKASVATTNANVYFDNLPLIEAAISLGGDRIALTAAVGTFAISSRIWMAATHNWEFVGAGMDETTIFVPEGLFYHGILAVYAAAKVVVKDVHLKGNNRRQGFGLTASTTETSIEVGNVFPTGLTFGLADACEARNVRVTDAFHSAFGVQYGQNNSIYDCEAVLTEPQAHYIQWQILWSDTTGGLIQGCHIEANHLTGGYESFRSDGVQFKNNSARNATCSLNSSGNWLMDGLDIVIEANSQRDASSFSENNPIFNVNSNIAPPHPSVAEGGTIRNFKFTVKGYINAGNDVPRGIVVNADNPNVLIEDGTYTAPDYAAPATNTYGAQGVVSDNALDTTVARVTVVGSPRPGHANIKIHDGTIKDCVAKVIDHPGPAR